MSSTTLTWKKILNEEFSQDYFQALSTFLKSEYAAKQTIYPPKPLIFNALKLTPFHQVRVVVLGQDPYHGPSQAMGLSFSVPANIPLPPSLLNIFKELASDLNIPRPRSGDLTGWAKQGVLLLNTVLTVRAGQANSHQGKGWEIFTDHLIEKLSLHREGLVFVLWGKPAASKIKLIDTQKHLVLTSAHPSPLAAHRGFFGCKHFSKINQFLAQQGASLIDWSQQEATSFSIPDQSSACSMPQ